MIGMLANGSPQTIQRIRRIAARTIWVGAYLAFGSHDLFDNDGGSDAIEAGPHNRSLGHDNVRRPPVR
jgi:hypothetical protein